MILILLLYATYRFLFCFELFVDFVCVVLCYSVLVGVRFGCFLGYLVALWCGF